MDIVSGFYEHVDLVFKIVGIVCGLMLLWVLLKLWEVLDLLKLILERIWIQKGGIRETMDSIRLFCDWVRRSGG